MDSNAMTGLFAQVGEFFREEVPAIARPFWEEVFAPLSNKDGAKLLELILLECEFLPRPARLRKVAAKMQEGSLKKYLDEGVRLYRTHGAKAQTMLPPFVRELFWECGGVSRYLEATVTDWPALESKFLKAGTEMLASPEWRGKALPSLGQWREEHKKTALPPSKPVQKYLVENARKAYHSPKPKPLPPEKKEAPAFPAMDWEKAKALGFTREEFSKVAKAYSAN